MHRLETWRRIHALYEAGRRGGEAEKEAQAREQYFRFEADVQDSLPAAGSTARAPTTAAGRARSAACPACSSPSDGCVLLIGLPTATAADPPGDEPFPAAIVFDWGQSRPKPWRAARELRRQRWQVKRRELELGQRTSCCRGSMRSACIASAASATTAGPQRTQTGAVRQRLHRPHHRRLPGMAGRAGDVASRSASARPTRPCDTPNCTWLANGRCCTNRNARWSTI